MNTRELLGSRRDVSISIIFGFICLQLLQTERPSEAHGLCEALKRRVDDNQIWVYYRLSPLTPILRSRELKQGGCDLKLPPSRIRSTIAGQEPWVSLVERLWREGPQGKSQSAQYTTMLRHMAHDDFAFVGNNPPLFYQNDLIATVLRYYWSEDAGYALWLRLAHSEQTSRQISPRQNAINSLGAD